ncbi:MAG: hypothetical protein ACPLYW_00980 [Candidatus Nanoarchaeia archaeon]
MGRKAISMILLVLLAVLLIAVGSITFYFLVGPKVKEQAPSTSTTPKPTTPKPALYVFNVEIDKFLYEDGELYMRLKISGEVDLKERINISGISGVHDYWFGRIDVTLPDGSEGKLFESENHTNIFTTFLQIPGTMFVDVNLPLEWYEKHPLEGLYNVTVWLAGPYENRTVIFEKTFNLKMALNATVSPTTWQSWEENVTTTVTNTGDLPLVFHDVSMITDAGRVIGWICQSCERIVIMPGETKQLVGTPTMAGEDIKEELAGKTLKVNFVLGIIGAVQQFSVPANVNFP